eukprot:TRINITY_DN4356_c0_g3_i1.p2 TRINITY_DN4356_c0_g3~~TRINITY_DN4356_c0_g3_i1.p2  ORF type:complete len:116 (-),score=31.50 TRINITY_DN4356_c0_g3_i1:72-419(-)
MVQRLTFRRRHCYATRSNRTRVVKTPGGKNVFQYVTKKAKGPSCGDCGGNIIGVPALRPVAYSKLSKNKKTVARAYGGSRCASCVRDRIVRAFLVGEQKIVKAVLKKAAASKEDK